ncbi:hypothetical protein OROGR_010113 [Orobanche gracilis]
MAKKTIVYFAFIFFAAVGMAAANAAAPSLAPTAKADTPSLAPAAKAAAPSLASAAKAAAPSLAPDAKVPAPSLAPAAAATGGLAEGPNGEYSDGTIGTISGTAYDAAPIGGPVPDGVFPDLTPAPAPASGTTALKVTAVAGAICAAGFVGSLFF